MAVENINQRLAAMPDRRAAENLRFVFMALIDFANGMAASGNQSATNFAAIQTTVNALVASTTATALSLSSTSVSGINLTY